MQSELKPCEDCAGTDLQVSWDETGFTKWWHVRCAECSNERSGGTQSEAIAAWNARASDAEITRLRAALRQIQDEGDAHSNAIATATLGGSDAE